MKKKLLAIALCMCTVFSVAGCSDKDSKKKEEKQETKYELGQYKGIEVDSSLKTVESEMVEEYLQSELQRYATDEELSNALKIFFMINLLILFACFCI